MIESEEKRVIITEGIVRWVKHTKTEQYLRDSDIPHLVDSIIQAFFPIGFCCGHRVKELDEGIDLVIDEPDGKTYGIYCKDCAEIYIKEGFAKREDKPNVVGDAEK